MTARTVVAPREVCPDCRGKTIEFRGVGLNTEYRICARISEPGHKTEAECMTELAQIRGERGPSSGRFG